MKLYNQFFGATAACVAALFMLAQPAAAQSSRPASQVTASKAESKAEHKGAERTHRLILQVNTNDPAAMNLALNNAANVDQYYGDLGEPVEIEIITFGPGLHMLRADTSPVKDRVKSMAESRPSVTFKACGNTQENMAKAENKKIPLVSQATVVPSGVVRVMELQEQGWSYVRP
jgi:intracellular sulfur oxidation DsrE/DsrF family protein